MAYNFLGLVNDVNRRLNEVELTEQNFAAAVGQYSQVKDAVNYAIRDINQDAYFWPFNFQRESVTLTPGITRYAFPTDYKTSSNTTFRLIRNNTFGNDTRSLRALSYEDYLASFIDQEYNTTDEGIRGLPEYVFKSSSLEFGVVPPPDRAYQVDYEYYRVPVDLVNPTDVPTMPAQFRKAINNGSMYYAFMFRSDVENTQLAQQKFQQDLKQLRGLYVNRHDYARSTMIERRPYSTLLNERIR